MHRIALALLVTTSIASAETKKYTLADLQALVATKAYIEAFEHLGDVAPSARTADWLDVAAKASIGYLETTLPSSRLEAMFTLERRYAQVLGSPAYRAARTKHAPDALGACFQNYVFTECRDWALQFVDADLKNGPLQLAIAKGIRRGMSHEGALPFFVRALDANKPTAVCPDGDVELAVVAGLSLPAGDTRIANAQKVATSCWADLREPIKKLTWEEGSARDHACALFKTRKEAAPRCPK